MSRSSGEPGWPQRLWRAFRSLRPEEALFVVGFVPSSIVTIWANVVATRAGAPVPLFESALLRLALATLLALTIPLVGRIRPRFADDSRAARGLDFYRTMLPFVLCIAIYTNLHDTVRFVNPHDIHDRLVAIEGWLFGGQPTVWAERYITPGRTEVMSVFYSCFFLIGPSAVLVLWLSGNRTQARHVLLAIIICFYTGYLLYVIFPAAPPRLYLESLGYYSKTLRGGPLLNFQDSLIRMMPHDASRAAFPSLHAGVSLRDVVVRVEVLPLVLSDSPDRRHRPAGVDGVSSPSLRGGSSGRRAAPSVGALGRSQIRSVVAARSAAGRG